MTATLTAEMPNPNADEELAYRVKVALKNAGFMQAVKHESYGSVVCSGYDLGPRGRLEYTEHVPDRAFRATQQQRMKTAHAMCAAYAAVLEAAGFLVKECTGTLTNRPYLLVKAPVKP